MTEVIKYQIALEALKAISDNNYNLLTQGLNHELWYFARFGSPTSVVYALVVENRVLHKKNTAFYWAITLLQIFVRVVYCQSWVEIGTRVWTNTQEFKQNGNQRYRENVFLPFSTFPAVLGDMLIRLLRCSRWGKKFTNAPSFEEWNILNLFWNFATFWLLQTC